MKLSTFLTPILVTYGVLTEAFLIPHQPSNQRQSISGVTRTASVLEKEHQRIYPSLLCNNSEKSSTSLFSTTDRNKREKTNSGVTSTVISNLAVVALKLRLAAHSGVSCEVSASSRSLFLKSSVGPITVRGRGWSSPLGLTCRAIDANVSECQLDMNAVVQRRKLILNTPAVGKAMVALDDQDFGNFLTHPLLEGQIPIIGNEKFEFDKDNVSIKAEDGHVIFHGKCGGESWRCILRRTGSGERNAAIEVMHVADVSTSTSSLEQDIGAMSMELSMVMTQFFNDLVFELDGTFLSFQDLKVHLPKSKDAQPQILISLDITVRKFPSPGVAF